ncbi:M48 family metalloprotease [Actinomadura sp. HBU206391]|uniref:M48 family metalloprotease n=1 Tax=Actinomadura sp. HBU206391 TaxID=2731692 RepID=UPI00164F11E3|nr:M48 family metalloprotease [Actinomadura sp. HBU206391]MBC6462099.1 M48 family metalloprotease [Actinomadura sp. HBU206391]
MSSYTFLPVAVTMILGVVLGRVPMPLHPVWSARLLVTVAATTALSMVGTCGFLAVNYGATMAPQVAGRLPEWALVGDDSPVPAALGVPATILTGVNLLIAAKLTVRWAGDVHAAHESAQGLLETDTPIALAVPGRTGGVLVSRGLLRRLSAEELEIVFHHERSHLRHRHHRYLAVGELAAGILPPLRPLSKRLRFTVERWADEDAAEAVGDRSLVARTIAKVALARSTDPGPLPAFGDSGVLQRVQALLGTPPGKNTVTGPVVLTGSGLATSALAAAALQLDHALASAIL